MEVRPFTIYVSDAVLDDLRQRLGQTRFPEVRAFFRQFRWRVAGDGQTPVRR